MTQMTQEEIVTNTKTVLQGLEALRVEHMSIIAGLTEGKKDPDKADIISKNIENIELGLGEAQVNDVAISLILPLAPFNPFVYKISYMISGHCCSRVSFTKY